MTDGYSRLLDLVEHEHALAAAGRLDELGTIDSQCRALLARLPAPAPVAAHPLLRSAAALQEDTIARLAASMSDIERELGRLSQGRVAIRGYGADVQSAGRRLDLTG